jgi:predicted RNA-binding Zn-ribbon protein involved in translation (DUF1610 family)
VSAAVAGGKPVARKGATLFPCPRCGARSLVVLEGGECFRCQVEGCGFEMAQGVIGRGAGQRESRVQA